MQCFINPFNALFLAREQPSDNKFNTVPCQGNASQNEPDCHQYIQVIMLLRVQFNDREEKDDKKSAAGIWYKHKTKTEANEVLADDPCDLRTHGHTHLDL